MGWRERRGKVEREERKDGEKVAKVEREGRKYEERGERKGG